MDLTTWAIDRLRAAPSVAALVGSRIYDQVPERPASPYVTVGRPEERDDEQAVTLTVVARYGGPEEARGVVAAARAALHDEPVNGGAARVTYADVYAGRAPLTTIGVLRLRAPAPPSAVSIPTDGQGGA